MSDLLQDTQKGLAEVEKVLEGIEDDPTRGLDLDEYLQLTAREDFWEEILARGSREQLESLAANLRRSIELDGS